MDLCLACESGKLELARLLVEDGANIDHEGLGGYTPLWLASCHSHVEIAKLLLDKGANIDYQDKGGCTPLLIAIRYGNLEVARLLLEKGANIEHRDKGECTPLCLASSSGQLEIAQLLLEKGANTEHQNKYGETPLYLACKCGSLELVRLLLEKGVNTDYRNKQSYNKTTPLCLACSGGHVEIARLLLEKGADIQYDSEEGESPLGFACHINQASQYIPHMSQVDSKLETIRLLLEKGADVEHQNKEGYTPLCIASRARTHVTRESRRVLSRGYIKNNLVEPLQKKQLEVVRLLLEKGANIEHQNNEGETPLCLAVMSGKVETARLLLDKGADIEHQSKKGETPLSLVSKLHAKHCWQSTPVTFFWSAEYGRLEVVRLLLDKGANIEHQNNEGETPLCLASVNGGLEVATLLLEKGANIKHRNKNGETSLCLASKQLSKLLCLASKCTLRDRWSFVRLLLDHGACIDYQSENGNQTDGTPLPYVLLQGAIQEADHEIVYKVVNEAAQQGCALDLVKFACPLGGVNK